MRPAGSHPTTVIRLRLIASLAAPRGSLACSALTSRGLGTAMSGIFARVPRAVQNAGLFTVGTAGLYYVILGRDYHAAAMK